MPKIELMIRRLETEEMLNAEFESEDACEQWLKERPSMVEVVKMVSKVEPDLESKLRHAMRPLDFKELGRREELAAAQRDKMRAERREEEGSPEPQPETDNRDPDRVMVVRWSEDKGFFIPDEHDEREVPQHVRDDMQAWIDERNTWVRDRNQRVSAAVVTVHPAKDHDGDRILPGGQFVTSDGPPAGN